MTKTKKQHWDPNTDPEYQRELARVVAQDRERAERREAARLAAESFMRYFFSWLNPRTTSDSQNLRSSLGASRA